MKTSLTIALFQMISVLLVDMTKTGFNYSLGVVLHTKEKKATHAFKKLINPLCDQKINNNKNTKTKTN